MASITVFADETCSLNSMQDGSLQLMYELWDNERARAGFVEASTRSELFFTCWVDPVEMKILFARAPRSRLLGVPIKSAVEGALRKVLQSRHG